MQIKKRYFLAIYALLPALSAIYLAAKQSFNSQSWINSVFSRSYLVVFLLLILLAIIFFFISLFSTIRSDQITNWGTNKLAAGSTKRSILLFSFLLVLTAGTLINYPDKYLSNLIAIFDRIRPLLIWLVLFGLQIIIGMTYYEIKNQKLNLRWDNIKPSFIVVGILFLIWLLIAFSGLGLNSANTFWSKAGVPILWPQILFALALGVLLTFFYRHGYSQNAFLDIVILTVIWGAAVILWNSQQFSPGVFDTQGRPPTFDIFPINDSMIFDVGAQKLLIGNQMIPDVIDKPFFIAFLALLHSLAGSSYATFYFFQILVFAFVPVAGYLIGKEMHSRALGVTFAALLVFKEWNAIALTNYIHVSTSKLILSEMLTSLGLLFFTYFFIKWMRSGRIWNNYLLLAGGTLGITSLVRLNTIGVLPFVILISLVFNKFRIRRWIISSFVLFLLVAVSMTPWLIRNSITSGNPFNFISSKTSGVIGNQRYTPIIKSNLQTQGQPKQSTIIVLGQNIANNFLHNLIGITVMIPPVPDLYNLYDMVRLPYWKLDWAGSLLPGSWWMIAGILTVISFGISSAWKKLGVTGLAPIAVLVGYNSTTAISLTSGGRYLVPMDWGVLLYFSIGLLSLFVLVVDIFLPRRSTGAAPSQAIKNLSPGRHSWQILAIGFLFLVLGSLPVIWEVLPAKAYTPIVSMNDFLNANAGLASSQATGMSTVETITGATVIHGKTLYPRYFGQNKGEGPTLADDPLIGSAGFDHLSFLVIGGEKDVPVLLPLKTSYSPQISGADVWVVGCLRKNYLEAVMVIFRNGDFIQSYLEDKPQTSCLK